MNTHILSFNFNFMCKNVSYTYSPFLGIEINKDKIKFKAFIVE